MVTPLVLEDMSIEQIEEHLKKLRAGQRKKGRKPSRPGKPKPPVETLRESKTLMHIDDGTAVSLNDIMLVIPPHVSHEDVIITHERDRYDDYSTVEVGYSVEVPNPKFEIQLVEYKKKMRVYEQKMIEFHQKLIEWEQAGP